MHRLVRRDTEKVRREFLAHLAAETPDDIERQIDGDEFDMGEGVPQGDPPPLRPTLAALGHLRWRQQIEIVGPGGTIGHGRGVIIPQIEAQPSQPPGARNLPRSEDFRARLSGQQRRADRVREAGSFAHASRAAARTSSACPFTFTFGQTRRMRPSSPIR